jgi:hypothetical protein
MPLLAVAHDLDDARDSLAYWEDRAHRLPRHALRRRREAIEMAERWRARVAEAERSHYGRGLLGALVLLAAEGRLPSPAIHAGRVAARRARQAALLLVAVVAALLITGAVAAVELLAAILRALT